MSKFVANMNSLKITETFANPEKYSPEAKGTIMISGREVVVRVFADTLYADGYIGRYHTSNNPWLATVMIDRREGERFGHVWAHFGRDDRAGRFHKEAGVSYEPETYAYELAKTIKENEAIRAMKDAKKAAKKVTKITKREIANLEDANRKALKSVAPAYTYAEGMTEAQKKAYRAKMRRQAKA